MLQRLRISLVEMRTKAYNSNLGPVNSCLSFSSRRLSLAVVWRRSGARLVRLGEERGEAAGEVSVELGLESVPPLSRLSALELNSIRLIDIMTKLLSTKLQYFKCHEKTLENL